MAKTVLILGSKKWKQWLCETLARLEMKVDSVLEKENQMATTLDQLNAKLDAIPPVLDAIVADEQAQKDQIQALKDQIAAGTPVSQDQLDALNAKADQVLARVQSIDASVP